MCHTIYITFYLVVWSLLLKSNAQRTPQLDGTGLLPHINQASYNNTHHLCVPEFHCNIQHAHLRFSAHFVGVVDDAVGVVGAVGSYVR